MRASGRAFRERREDGEPRGEEGAVQEERLRGGQLHHVPGDRVSKPLASVSWILDKGNTVVFSRSREGSYIRNEATGEKVPIIEDKGTFVMGVEFLEPAGFSRQGR